MIELPTKIVMNSGINMVQLKLRCDRFVLKQPKRIWTGCFSNDANRIWTKMMNVCVFGSSSKSTETSYVTAAYRLGELIAERGHTCVNGAGRYGVMGGVNNGCSSKGGKIVGIIHSIF